MSRQNNWYQMKLRLLREENARLKQLVDQLAASQTVPHKGTQ